MELILDKNANSLSEMAATSDFDDLMMQQTISQNQLLRDTEKNLI
jgi:hypothetical protein